MSSRKDIINIKNDYINKVDIPIVPVTHMNLERYLERTSYSKLMLNDFDKISSIRLNGSNKYTIYDDVKSPYYLKELNDSHNKFKFKCYLGDANEYRWFALYKRYKMITVIIVTDLLHGKKYPYRFYNDVYRKVEYYDNLRFKIIESEKNYEQSIHRGLFTQYKTGLRSFTEHWYAGHRRKEAFYICFSNDTTQRPSDEHRDYSDIYHSNDSFFFVGSRGQMFQLAFTMVDRKMDRIYKHRIISRHYYDKMKHLNSGIIPDNMKENTGQFSINVAGVEIPIIDRIGDDDFVFYKHNFDEYEGVVKEKLTIE